MIRILFPLFVVFFAFSARSANDPLRELLTHHPSWMVKTVTSHDFWGGNGDGQFFGGKETNYRGHNYKILFHEKGEGLIQRFLISALQENIEKDYLGLVVLIDGQEIYGGNFFDFFSGKSKWQHPLVYDISQSSGSYVSYVPFAYKKEAKILMRNKPYFYQVTYREGSGSSVAPNSEETRRFMLNEWWKSTPVPLRSVQLRSGAAVALASGSTLVTRAQIRLASAEQLKHLKIQIGNQAPIPLAFYFGLGVTGEETDQGLTERTGELTSSLAHVNPKSLTFTSRQPVPLKAGESLRLISSVETTVEVAVQTDFPLPNVRFEGQFREQWGQGKETTMTLFEAKGAMNLASTVMEITDGPAGSQYYLEGEEMIRVDGLDAPVQLGTGTEEYFGGGWYFWNVFSNFFSGLPRRTPLKTDGTDWKSVVFEHSLYRQHVLDPLVARTGLRLGFEAGDHGQFTPIRYRTFVSAYVFESLKTLGQHQVKIPANDKIRTWVDGEREQNQKPRDLFFRFIADGKSAFKIECPHQAPSALLLVRTFDGGRIDQHGEVKFNDRAVGTFFNGYANTARRFAQDSLWVDLTAEDCEADKINVVIEAKNWTESDYQVTFFGR